MSLKENISMVKEELSSEEKFFEQAVVTERFVKKYKNVIISLIVIVVLVAAANMAYEINISAKRENANKALASLMKNPNDQNALSELKDASPNLYDVWKYSNALISKDSDALEKLKNSKAILVDDLVKYELAKDEASLENYALKQDAIYRDLALVEAAVMLINKDKIQDAHNMLQKISKESSVYQLANALLHYGVK